MFYDLCKEVFTNIKELLPKRIEAMGVNEKIFQGNIKKTAQAHIKKMFNTLQSAEESIFIKKFEKNKLIIAVKNPQWAARVYLIKEDLKEKIEEQSNIKITDIIIVIEDKP